MKRNPFFRDNDEEYRDLARAIDHNSGDVEEILRRKKLSLADDKSYALWLGMAVYMLIHPTQSGNEALEINRVFVVKREIFPPLWKLLFKEDGSIKEDYVWVDMRVHGKHNVFSAIARRYNIFKEQDEGLEKVLFGDLASNESVAKKMLQAVLTFSTNIRASSNRAMMLEACTNFSGDNLKLLQDIFTAIRRFYNKDEALQLLTDIMKPRQEEWLDKSVMEIIFNTSQQGRSSLDVVINGIRSFGPHEMNSELSKVIISTIPKKISNSTFLSYVASAGIEGKEDELLHLRRKLSCVDDRTAIDGSSSDSAAPSSERRPRFSFGNIGKFLGNLGGNDQQKRPSGEVSASSSAKRIQNADLRDGNAR